MTTYRVNEKTTARYTATLVDETDAVVPASSLSTLTLTLFDEAAGTIINSRNAQDVLNTNGVTVSAAGALVWTMDPADNAIVSAIKGLEAHRAMFAWTYGSKGGKHEVRILVENLAKVS